MLEQTSLNCISYGHEFRQLTTQKKLGHYILKAYVRAKINRALIILAPMQTESSDVHSDNYVYYYSKLKLPGI